ncbi:C-C motif chemokine 2-like [Megalops cyprinoides]|uniref:C-C motif chemokine 2-like n=1 Tax=Megalops cyprinoides TaxID=118141 RepID=UPI0018640F51|nr:C-C motif chemokine 2-like [Megalops cyprinoides]
MKLHLTAVFLCVAAWIACLSATSGPTSSCCLMVTDTRVHPKNIVDYKLQTSGLCPVQAVVLQTRKGKVICSEPEKEWVKRAMQKVDKEKARRKKAATCKLTKKMKTLIAVFLCLAALLLFTGLGQATGPVASCCLKTTKTRVNVTLLSRYYMQKSGMCPVEAVVFTTMKGITICSSPTSLWAKKAMAHLNAKGRTYPTTAITTPGPTTEDLPLTQNSTDKAV